MNIGTEAFRLWKENQGVLAAQHDVRNFLFALALEDNAVPDMESFPEQAKALAKIDLVELCGVLHTLRELLPASQDTGELGLMTPHYKHLVDAAIAVWGLNGAQSHVKRLVRQASLYQ